MPAGGLGLFSCYVVTCACRFNRISNCSLNSMRVKERVDLNHRPAGPEDCAHEESVAAPRPSHRRYESHGFPFDRARAVVNAGVDVCSRK